MRTLTHLPVLAAALAASAGSVPARADVTQAYYSTNTNYGYKITGMPDMDQKRAELPGNGAMYCVPTSTLNLFSYAATHGFPDLDPGSYANWSIQGYYNHCTPDLIYLGFLMGTDAVEGTKGGWAGGAAAWVSGSLLSTHKYSRSSDYSPSIGKMTKKAVHGAIVAFNMGSYVQLGVQGGVPSVVRDGGHAVTLQRSYRSGTQRILRYRNPWTPNSDSLTTQSVNQNETVNPVTSTFYLFSSQHYADREDLYSFVNGDGFTVHRLFDGFLTVKPLYGLTFAGSADSAATQLSTIAPVWLEGSLPPPANYSVPAGHELIDVAFDMEEEEAIVITKTGLVAALYHLGRIDLTNGAYTEIPLTLQPKGVCTGRKHQIYVHNGSDVYRLDAQGNVVSSNLLTPTPSALAYNDASDELVLLSVADRKVVRYTEDLVQIASHTPAAAIPMSGRGWVTVSTGGRIWYATDASNALRGVIFSGGPVFSLETIALPGIVDPTGLVAGNDDDLFVTSQGTVRALKKNSRGAWAFDTSSPFHGQPGGERMTLLTSRSDLPVGDEEGPEWRNIDLTNEPQPPESGDCLGDLDENDIVNGADLAIMLSAWGPNAGLNGDAGDVNRDGAVNGADLAILLSYWGPCPD